MKHVIITGGSGFIGSHLSDAFLDRGYAVTAVDNFVTGRRENVKQALKRPEFDLVELDVSKGMDEQAFKLLRKFGLHGVLHFACPASPVDFAKIPFEILAVDSAGTINTIDLALKYDARYIVASTSEIYGDPLEHPQKEEYWGNVNTLGPRACYDETKRFAEACVSTAWKIPKGGQNRLLNAGIVRIFNTYGPRMRPDDGRVVPELCMQVLRGEPMTLHGDGKQTRSFCYVSDLVEGIIKLYESGLRDVVNIGNPVERSMLDFAKALAGLQNTDASIKFLPGRQDDPKRRCPDISKAKRLLGWSPKVEFADGLRMTLEYFREGLGA
jgi:nucleoside-diphosphate-sugar epimerase